MPAVNEVVPNKPLTGAEAAKIISDDVDYMLAHDGMFTEHMAYGRLMYEITVRVLLDNQTYPEHVVLVRSKAQPKGNGSPVEPPPNVIPLKTPLTEEAILVAKKRTRVVESPNRERVKRGMPVTREIRDRDDGHMKEEKILYGKEVLSGGADSGLDTSEGVTDEDVIEKTKADWGL